MSAQAETPLISLVVPSYNEQEAVTPFFAQTLPVLSAMHKTRFEIVCIDDGSTDATLERLVAASASEPRISIIELSRNFGKQAALMAGIESAAGDAVMGEAAR